MIALVCWPKHMNFSVETYLSGEVMRAFVFLLTSIAWAPCFAIHWHTTLRKGPQEFWLYCHDCQTQVVRCWNKFFLLARLIQTTWSSQLIGTKWRLAAYFIRTAFEQWLNTIWEIKPESAQISCKTYYQECGCHLYTTEILHVKLNEGFRTRVV